jgi:hypothetical protein
MIFPENYLFIYDHLMAALIFFTVLSYAQHSAGSVNRLFGFIIPVFIILYIGTRPISSAFVDMVTYAQAFEVAKLTGAVYYNDWLFNALILGLSQITTVEVFFFVCAAIYIAPVIAGLKKRHGDSAFAALLAMITSFSFFTYGVNGVRNGMATSILLAAIAWSDRKFAFIFLALLAYGMHNSVAIPILFYTLSFLYSNVIFYSCLWLSALLFTFATSGSIAGYLGTFLSLYEERRIGYLTETGEDKGGLRIDFVLYSILPVLASYLLADANKTKDLFYRRMLCAYLATNGFWILVMYAAYSNRIAYLSWFIMPWLIIYPFIPNRSWGAGSSGQKIDVAKYSALLIGQFALTYLFDIIIYPNR